jgi:hypothetical protein
LEAPLGLAPYHMLILCQWTSSSKDMHALFFKLIVLKKVPNTRRKKMGFLSFKIKYENISQEICKPLRLVKIPL